jgi:hypothetical protein
MVGAAPRPCHLPDLHSFSISLLMHVSTMNIVSNKCSFLLQPQRIHSLLNQLIIFFLFMLPHAKSISFNFSTFQTNMNNIIFQGDAFPSSGVLQLTKNQLDASITHSAGRATYAEPVRLWDAKTGRLTDFSTHFTFVINATNMSEHGDGLSFFISPFQSVIPNNSSGGFLELFDSATAFNMSLNQIVAVEFDTFKNDWDPSDDHVGINVNSIASATNVSWNTSMRNGSTGNAWVSYNSTSKNLSVFLTYADNPVFSGNSNLSYVVDLRNVLQEWVRVGFSAATGDC